MALGPKTDNSIEGGDGNAQVGHNSGTIIIGYTIEQHEAALERALTRERGHLESTHGVELERIHRDIVELQSRLDNKERDYEERVKELHEYKQKLEQFSNQIEKDKLDAAKIALDRGDDTLAEALFKEALEKVKLSRVDEKKAEAELEFELGKIAERKIRWHDALGHFLRAERLDRTIENATHVAGVFSNLGFFDRALALLDEHLVGEQISEINLELYNVKMTVLAFARQTEKASEVAKEIDVFLKKTKRPDAGLVLNIKVCLLRALVSTDERGQFQAILKDTRKPLKSLEKEDPVNFARVVGNIASLMADTGFLTGAISLTRNSLKILKAEMGDKHPLYAIRLNNLGDFLTRDGKCTEAVKYLQEAIKLGSEYLPKGHHSLLVRRYNLALAFEKQGEVMKAVKARQQVFADSFLQVHLNHDLICGNLSVLVRLRLDVKDTSGAVKAIDWFEKQTDVIPLSVKARQPLVDAIQECRGAVFDHAMRA